MNKRETILLAAINLFAKKGYHETSMRNIAAESNIAKGTIYSYFHSKDELLFSIIKYFNAETKLKLEGISRSSLTAKEIFKSQIEVTLEERLKYKDFFMIQHREQTLNSSTQIKGAFLEMQEEKLRWMAQGFIDVYGLSIEKHCFDLSAVLDSLILGFIRILSINNDVISIKELATYILNCIDAIVLRIMEEKASPLFPINYKDQFFDYIRLSSSNHELDYQLKQMITIIQNLEFSATKKEDFIKTMNFLKEEINQKEPRNIIVKGIVNELGEVPELVQPLNKIKQILQIN